MCARNVYRAISLLPSLSGVTLLPGSSWGVAYHKDEFSQRHSASGHPMCCHGKGNAPGRAGYLKEQHEVGWQRNLVQERESIWKSWDSWQMGGRGLGRTFLTGPQLHVSQFDRHVLNGKENLKRL